MKSGYVSKEKSTYPLLSEKSSKKLKLLQYNEEFLVNKLSSMQDEANDKHIKKSTENILLENKNVFSARIGKLKNYQVSLMIDETVTPIVQKPRKIPFNLAEKAERKIEELLKADIIEIFPDDEPRTW